jgi:hypothetical protein
MECAFDTATNSSLEVAFYISELNKTIDGSKISPTLTTIDVESLYTNIPQNKLLDVINDQLVAMKVDSIKRFAFIKYLETLICYNIFSASGHYYIQKIGIPMGGVLSPCLANIYLGVMEKNVQTLPGVLIYKRYVDDILLISLFNDIQIEDFIRTLQSSFELTLTASYNPMAVNFLDTNISYSRIFHKFFLSPFTKNVLLFPLPSTLFRRPFYVDVNIIKSQILRVWRLCTNTATFSTAIEQYLLLLLDNSYFFKIRCQIIIFLYPIRIAHNIWSTSIPLCKECQYISQTQHIHVSKFLLLDTRLICTKQPLRCSSKNIFIIVIYWKVIQIYFIHNVNGFYKENRNHPVLFMAL